MFPDFIGKMERYKFCGSSCCFGKLAGKKSRRVGGKYRFFRGNLSKLMIKVDFNIRISGTASIRRSASFTASARSEL
jgi:hypothetical protein